MAQGSKTFKRGEYIFKEGDKAENIYVVESGKVSIIIERGSAKIELQSLAAGQILGLSALVGLRQHTSTAICSQNCSLMEMPALIAKNTLEGGSPISKVLNKSLIEQIKTLSAEHKSMKLEKDTSPCPQVKIATTFSILNYVMRYVGQARPNDAIGIAWSSLKNYAVKMFLDSPERMENMCKILTKLGHAEMKYAKREDAENDNDIELSEIIILNPNIIGEFAEFYAYNMYKKGKNEIIYVNERCLKMALVIAENYYDVPVDHKGATKVAFSKVSEDMSKAGIQFKAQDLNLLEARGLFVTSYTPEKSENLLIFDYQEIANTAIYWQIILEIDRWNERGQVLMQEPKTAAPDLNQLECPNCKAKVTAEQKFCGECGHKINA